MTLRSPNSRCRLSATFTIALLVCAAGLAAMSRATEQSVWVSPATGQSLALDVREPVDSATGPRPVVFYLVGLAAPRVGTEADAPIIADLQKAGNLVAVLDYGKAPESRWPFLNRDLQALREGLQKKTLLADRNVDVTSSVIVPSGHRLRRNVVYARHGERSLAMDIVYPSQPTRAAGAVIEFSCDNQNRLGNGSLVACSDTMVEGAATEGFIAAMADHPVAAPYKGIDPMPECAELVKAAVRTLRAEALSLGGNGRIVPIGFSRGSGMALMLVSTAGNKDFETAGEHREISSSVEGAVIMSGRFTYLDLLANDHMLPRYAKAWGARESHVDVWRLHGALDHLKDGTVPLFLTINRTEGADAQHQMKVLRARLSSLGSPAEFVEDPQPRGHKVPLDPVVLKPMSAYLHARLD